MMIETLTKTEIVQPLFAMGQETRWRVNLDNLITKV